MALADTGKAIRNASELLKYHLETRLKPPTVPGDFKITVGKPESSRSYPGLNLFLYEAVFDPTLKNISLAEGQPPPLWLVLRYILTPYDSTNKCESDTLEALEYLGQGIRVLRGLNYLQITPSLAGPLEDNPEPLKITFNNASSELLSRLMQGSDEKYRFSMLFEIRPVMIAPEEPPARSLLVGIDYTSTPPDELTEPEKGVHIDVLPAMGPVIKSITPDSFQLGDVVTLAGDYLDSSGLSVRLGPVGLGVTAQPAGKLQFKIEDKIGEGDVISAGSHPLKVVKELSYGRTRSGNLRVASLLPGLESAAVTPGSVNYVPHPLEPGKDVVEAEIKLDGKLLGTDKDDIIVCFNRDGKTGAFVEVTGSVTQPPPLPPTQRELTLNVKAIHKLPPGNYRVILLVNGQQARNSPQVKLETP